MDTSSSPLSGIGSPKDFDGAEAGRAAAGLVPLVRDPLPQVHHPVPLLGREWVPVLSTERELRLASAEGLGLAWE